MASKTEYHLDRRLLDKIIAGQKLKTTSTGSVDPAPYDQAFKGTAYDDTSGPSVFSRGLDLISRPLYAVQNLIKDSVDPDPQTNNPLESLWAGFSGIDKTTGSDVIQKYEDQNPNVDVPDWVKGWGGFVSDVALDPLTWTTFGIGGLIKKGATAAHTALSGTEKYNAAVRGGAGLTEFTPKEIANLKGSVEGLPGDAAKMTEKEAKDAEVPVPEQVVAEQTNAARRADIGETVVEEAKVNPAAVADELNKPSLPKTEDLGVGTKWKPGDKPVANDYAQAKTVADITRKASTAATKAGHAGQTRTAFMREELRTGLAAAKETDFARGIYPVVPLGDNHYFLHANDVFDALGDDLNKVHLSGFDKVPTSSLLQGAARTIEGRTAGLSGDELLAAVKESVIKGHKTKQVISSRRAEVSAKALISAGPKLEEHMLANEVRIGKRDLATGHTLGTKIGSDTARVVNDPQATVADSLSAAADIKGSIIREGRQQGLSPGGMAVGARAADDAVGGTLKATDEAGARATLGSAKDVAKGKPENVQVRQSSQARKDAKEVDDELAKLEEKAVYVDLGEKIAMNIDKGINRLYAGLLGGTLHGFRQGTSSELYRLENGFQERVQQIYNDKLSAAVKKHGDDQFHAAANFVNSGGKIPKNDPVLAAAMTDAKELMDHVHSPDGLVANALLRQGIGIDTFNAVTDSKGLKKYNLSKTKSGFVDESSLAEMRKWPIDDWPDYLSRMQSAALEASTRKAVGNDFARLYGVKEFQPGYVKIAKTDYDRAPMSHFTDNTLWYPREIVDEMRKFNNQIDKRTSFQGDKGAVAGFVNKVLDRYLRLWKPSVTIFRVGHHIKNFMGDGMMNYVAGVKNPKHYDNAFNAIRSNGQFKGDIKELERMYASKELVDHGAKGNKLALTVTLKGGEKVPVTQAQLYQVGMRSGGLTSYRTAEDILAKNETKINAVDRATDKLMESRPVQFAGKVSENSNHLHILAQMSHLLSDSKFTSKFSSIEEAGRAAASEALKWHPNAAGLAKTEAKYGRRVAPFYTWFRQAVPRLMMSMLDHPGRITSYPKATYAFQQSIGMDPESYSEPFSGREALPSFMKGMVSGNIQIGDKNFGYNLGSPAETLASIFSGGSVPVGEDGEVPSPLTSLIKGTGSNIAGMINPLLTLPFEMTQSTDVTGKHVTDVSENLDQAIPFASTLAGVTGYSPTGTIGNLFNSQPNTPLLDPQRANAQGEKDFLLNQSTLNWLLGLGITNVNDKRYTNIALRESRS